jgi:hypothetical protein
MNQRVWRFELEIADEQQLVLPRMSKILKFAMDCTETKISVWVQHSAEADDGWDQDPVRYETRSFRVVGTGHPIPDWERLQHHDTLVANGGSLIWHVYEVV